MVVWPVVVSAVVVSIDLVVDAAVLSLWPALPAAIALDESDLSAQHLAQTVSELQNDRGRLLSIGENARALARLDAAQRVTAQCLEVIGA